MNRKGVIYTVVAVILLIAISALFFTQSRRTGHESQAAAAERIRTLDLFLDDLVADSTRAAHIAGFRSLIAMEQHIASTGEYIDDPEAAFLEIFMGGNLSNTTFIIMENSTFSQYLMKVQEEAGRQGISLTVNASRIGLWQADPWNIMVNYTLEIDMTDARGTARWRTTRNISSEVPITDLRDPLFTAETLSRVQRVIKRTNITVFVNDVGDANDTTGLMQHFNRTLYVSAGRGPNMLMRFAGNLSDDRYGIESLVDTEELAAQDLDVDIDAAITDFRYFNGTPADACRIQNTPTIIKLATDDLDVYQVEGALEYDSCP